jgi:RNA polymerase sigma factor (sigma-70 family)
VGAREVQQPAQEQRCSPRTRAAVEQLYRDGNRDALVGELRSRVSQAEAEDLIQRSIERALSGRCRAEHVGGVHAWVRQDAQFALSHLLDRRRVAREKLVRERNALPRPDEIPGPEAEMLREGNAELAAKLVEEAGLSPLDQNIVRLYWGERLPRKLVAGELGIAEGTLKKRLARAGTAFEALLVKRCGGGCGGEGQRDVVAYAFQHRRMPEGTLARAVEHMKDCERCERLFSRLEQVRLAVAALTPVPLGMPGAASPSTGLPERLGEGLAWAREQMTTLSMRVHEIAMAPPPVKPGATLASIGVCAVAAGGSYCLEGTVAPLRALSPPAHEQLQSKKPDKPRRASQAVPAGNLQYGSPPPVAAQPAPSPVPDPSPAPDPDPEPASPESTQPQPQPAPAQEFDFEQSAPAPSSPSSSSAPSQPKPQPQPSPAPSSGGGGGGGGGGSSGGEFL